MRLGQSMSRYNSILVATFVGVVTIAVSAISLTSQRPSEVAPVNIPHDPLRAINTSPRVPSGLLSYLANVQTDGPPRPIDYDLVLRETGRGSLGRKRDSAFRLTADYGNNLFGCVVSPNGQYILLKEGSQGDNTSSYHLFIWNVASKRLSKGPEVPLQNQTVAWSPDSEHFSFIEGGGADGFEMNGEGPLRLETYDLKTKTIHFIVQNPAVNSHSWTRRGTLLCTLQAAMNEQHPTLAQQRTSIYEIPMRGGIPVKLIENGANPSPSPDGRWIAFFGWPDAGQEAKQRQKAKAEGQAVQRLPAMYLFDRKLNRRLLLRVVKPDAPHDNVAWSADSKLVYLVWNDYKSARPPIESTQDNNHYPGHGTGYVEVVQIPSLARRVVTTLTASDADARYDVTTQFQIKGISDDSRFLFIQIQNTGQTIMRPPFWDQFNEMDAIAIKDGTRQTVWATLDAVGLDWTQVPY